MSSASSIQALTDWKKDVYLPAHKYVFLLDGKPYRGPFNKKYVGNQITYYTGIKPTRYSQQLEYKPKGFEVENEPVETAMDKWVKQERKIDPLIRQVPIYGSNLGIADEAIRPPVLGYQIVRSDPNTGERNVLATYYDNKLKEIVKPSKIPHLLRTTSPFFTVPRGAIPPPPPALSGASMNAYSPFRLRTPQTPAPEPITPSPAYEEGPVNEGSSIRSAGKPPPEYEGIQKSTTQIQGKKVGIFLKNNSDVIKQEIRSLGKKSQAQIIRILTERYNLSLAATELFFKNNTEYFD